jgi:curved DNA-binding protein CbpA
VKRDEARSLLALPVVFGADEVELAFRRQAREAHPDHGGDPERFKALVEGRRILLSPPARSDGSVVFVDGSHRLRRFIARLRQAGPPKPPRVI